MKPDPFARPVELSRGSGKGQGVRKRIGHCTADDLRKGMTVAQRKRDREARRVQGVHSAKLSNKARKLNASLEHALDAIYFDKLAQALTAMEYGRRARWGKDAESLPTLTVRDLGEAKLHEIGRSSLALLTSQTQGVIQSAQQVQTTTPTEG